MKYQIEGCGCRSTGVFLLRAGKAQASLALYWSNPAGPCIKERLQIYFCPNYLNNLLYMQTLGHILLCKQHQKRPGCLEFGIYG